MNPYISVLLSPQHKKCITAYFTENLNYLIQFYESYEQMMMDCEATCSCLLIPCNDSHMDKVMRFAHFMRIQVGFYMLDHHECRLYEINEMPLASLIKDSVSQTLQLKRRNEIIRIYMHDILYIESQKIYIIVHTTQGIQKFRMRLCDILTQLDPSHFRRCHQSYIVNLNFIYSMKRYEIILQNGARIPISKAYTKTMRCSTKASDIKKVVQFD